LQASIAKSSKNEVEILKMKGRPIHLTMGLCSKDEFAISPVNRHLHLCFDELIAWPSVVPNTVGRE